jgi:hypothetical protein
VVHPTIIPGVVDEISDEVCEKDGDLIIVDTHPAEGWIRRLLKGMDHPIVGCCQERTILVVKSWRGE